jgi:hypothetical protein
MSSGIDRLMSRLFHAALTMDCSEIASIQNKLISLMTAIVKALPEPKSPVLPRQKRALNQVTFFIIKRFLKFANQVKKEVYRHRRKTIKKVCFNKRLLQGKT